LGKFSGNTLPASVRNKSDLPAFFLHTIFPPCAWRKYHVIAMFKKDGDFDPGRELTNAIDNSEGKDELTITQEIFYEQLIKIISVILNLWWRKKCRVKK